MIQIDGLSRKQMERATAKGNMPFISKAIHRGGFHVETFYSGIPSTTPAVQGEIFYGVKAAVPAFEFLQRKSGKMFRMFDPEAASEISKDLTEKCNKPLLLGGHAYSNIYRAGAAKSWYCAEDLAVSVIINKSRPFKWILLSLIYSVKILRMAALALLELVLALIDCFRGLFAKEDLCRELIFVPVRISVCILLREFIRFRVLLDIEKGVRVIHANFLGYDEQAHRRGPGSDFAHWTLKGIDAAIRDICRAALRSDYRDYEVIIYSDHGQEHAIPYSKSQGRTLNEALTEIFASGPLAGLGIGMPSHPRLVGNTVDRWRSSPIAPAEVYEEKIVVAAMGPLGHVYLPANIDDDAKRTIARRIVDEGNVPLVLLRNSGGETSVRVFNPEGEWLLPDDAERILGSEHPLLGPVTEDLFQLCRHPDGGDLILSGWSPKGPQMSFPLENGSHAGPGTEETRGFVLLPDRFFRLPAEWIRGCDLHKMVGDFLKGTHHPMTLSERISKPQASLRVMTYNIHSCVGMDGKLRPERIARVINRLNPDIIAVQEVDAHRSRSGHHHQAKVIAEHLKMNHAFYSMLEEEKEEYGIAIFSRYPIRVVKSALLTKADPKRLKEGRGAIWITVDLENFPTPINIINTHFGLGRDERRRQIDVLSSDAWMGRIDSSQPVILCGDFNSTARSPIWKRLNQNYREVQNTIPGHLRRATFATIRPFARLDHIFVSPHWKVAKVEVPHFPGVLVASDHFPLCADLELSKPEEYA